MNAIYTNGTNLKVNTKTQIINIQYSNITDVTCTPIIDNTKI